MIASRFRLSLHDCHTLPDCHMHTQDIFTQSLLHETVERRAELIQRGADPLGDGWIGNQVGWKWCQCPDTKLGCPRITTYHHMHGGQPAVPANWCMASMPMSLLVLSLSSSRQLTHAFSPLPVTLVGKLGQLVDPRLGKLAVSSTASSAAMIGATFRPPISPDHCDLPRRHARQLTPPCADSAHLILNGSCQAGGEECVSGERGSPGTDERIHHYPW